MPLSLHDAFVPSCQQILGAMAGLIEKAQAHAKENGLDDADLLGAKLAEDMWPLPYHVRSVWVHSALVISLLESGEFSPDFTEVPDSWDSMRAQIKTAQDSLSAVDPDTLEGLADNTIGFVLGGKRLMELSASNFLLSFSQPNFYFHASTFYDILRMKGVPVGKRDFMGAVRILG